MKKDPEVIELKESETGEGESQPSTHCLSLYSFFFGDSPASEGAEL